MKVSELMSTPANTCRLDDDLSAAACIMWDCDCGTVPVVDGDGRCVGMITDRDIAMACYTQNKSPREILVSSIASRALVAVKPNDDVSKAEQAMCSAQVRRVPVLGDRGEPVGVLSLTDLARNVRRNGRDSLGPEPVATTLAAISTPRPMESARV